VQTFAASADDTRAKVETFQLCERPGDICREVGIGRDVHLSHIYARDHPKVCARLKAKVKDRMGDAWPKIYHDMIDLLDPMQVVNLYQFPHDAKLRKHGRKFPILLIGDALHCMTALSGHGGNLALADAMDAAQYILNGKSSKKGAEKLMKEMLARSRHGFRVGEWGYYRLRRLLTISETSASRHYSAAIWREKIDEAYGRGSTQYMTVMHWIHTIERHYFQGGGLGVVVVFVACCALMVPLIKISLLS
jgi:hypothetical protein